jgi:hypothetical protein
VHRHFFKKKNIYYRHYYYYCHRNPKTFVFCRNLYKKRNPRAAFVQNSKQKEKQLLSASLLFSLEPKNLYSLFRFVQKEKLKLCVLSKMAKHPLLLLLLSFSPGRKKSYRYHNVWKRRENNKYSLVSVSSGCCWELLVGGEHFWFRNRHLNQYHHLHSWWSTRE